MQCAQHHREKKKEGEIMLAEHDLQSKGTSCDTYVESHRAGWLAVAAVERRPGSLTNELARRF